VRVSIGTAQFGLDYGISNITGKISPNELKLIFDFMKKNDLNEFDSAQNYGEIEEIIGKKFSDTQKPVNVVSKYTINNTYRSGDIKNILTLSLNHLQASSIYGLLIHNFLDYSSNPNIWDEMVKLRKDGLIKNIGFSLYKPSELDLILDRNLDFDIIQIPFNIFDQRFKCYFDQLKKRNILIYVRSIFMQGLVFLNSNFMDKKINFTKKYINFLTKISINSGLSINSLCLNYALAHDQISKIIIGVTSSEQLSNNISLINQFDKSDLIFKKLENLQMEDDDLSSIMKFLVDFQINRENLNK
jgi:aryl-alcohol dehydrogenase-like predicted oxidoreductase